jgi:hypothetical protein
MTISRKEIDETVKFLEDMVKASHAEWGDKLSRWREGQYGVVDDDLKAWVLEYTTQQVLAETVEAMQDTMRQLLYDDNPLPLEEQISSSMERLTAVAVTQGITLGLELHRRYCA